MVVKPGVRRPGRRRRRVAAAIVYPSLFLAAAFSGCSPAQVLRWPTSHRPGVPTRAQARTHGELPRARPSRPDGAAGAEVAPPRRCAPRGSRWPRPRPEGLVRPGPTVRPTARVADAGGRADPADGADRGRRRPHGRRRPGDPARRPSTRST